MAVIANLIARLGLDPRDFEKKLKRAEKKLAKTSRKFKELGRSLTVSITAPLGAVGLIATKQFASFDDALRRSAAIMRGAGKRMDELSAKAREIGKTSTFSATQAAEAFFFLASAGFDAQQSIDALGAVTTFAEAGSFDLATATDLLTDAQSAMGLSADDAKKNLENLVKVSDALVGANTLANATTRQFSEALTAGAAVAARNAGLSLNETVAILAVYADQGIKGADASTKLRIALRDLQDRAIESQEAFKKLGITVFDAGTGALLPMTKIIASLEKRFENMSVREKRVTLRTLEFQQRSVLALQTLIGFSDAIKSNVKQLDALGGVTQDVADKNLASFSSQIKLLISRIDDVVISLGKEFAEVIQKDVIPAIDVVIEIIAGLVFMFSELDKETKKAILAGAAFAAILGPLSIAIGGVVGVLGLLAPLIGTAFIPILAGGAVLVGLTILARKLLQSEEAAQAFAGALVGASEAMQRAADASRTLIEQLNFERLVGFKDKIFALQEEFDRLQISLKSGDLTLPEFIKATMRANETAKAIERVNAEMIQFAKSTRAQETVEVGVEGGGDAAGILGLFDTIKQNISGIRDLGVTGGMQLSESFSNALREIDENSRAIFGTVGDTINQFQESANEAWRNWVETGQEAFANVQLAVVGFLDSFTTGFGDAIARIVVFQEDFQEVMFNFLTNLLAQVISTLAQIVIQWLLATALQNTIGTKAHAVRTGQAAQLIFLNTVASIAAIPVIGPPLALKAATALTAKSLAGSVAAFAAGGAAGAATGLTGLQTGGLVLGDGLAFLHAGEQVLSEEDVDRNVMAPGAMTAIDFRVELDGRQMMRVLLPHLAQEIRLRGV